METNEVKNLLSGAKDISEIIKLIEKAEYSTAKQYINYILESNLKQEFKDKLCKTDFSDAKYYLRLIEHTDNYKLLKYFHENMNLATCKDVLNYLAINGQSAAENSLIHCLYSYMIYKAKINRKEVDQYFMDLIKSEPKIIKFIKNIDFLAGNIDNDIISKNIYLIASDSCKMQNIIWAVKLDIDDFKAKTDEQKKEFEQTRGLFIYELMSQPDIQKTLPLEAREENGKLKGCLYVSRKPIEIEIWRMFTEALKFSVEKGISDKTKNKNLLDKKWFEHILKKMAEICEHLQDDIDGFKRDFVFPLRGTLKDEFEEKKRQLSSMVLVMCDFVFAVERNYMQLMNMLKKNQQAQAEVNLLKNSSSIESNEIKEKLKIAQKNLSNTKSFLKNFDSVIDLKSYFDEDGKYIDAKYYEYIYDMYDVIYENIAFMPYEFFEKMVRPKGNFAIECIVDYKSKLNDDEIELIRKKAVYKHKITINQGIEEIYFDTDKNGNLVLQKFEPPFIWRDKYDSLEKQEVMKKKESMFKKLRGCNRKCLFLYGLNDIIQIMKSDNEEMDYAKYCFWNELYKDQKMADALGLKDDETIAGLLIHRVTQEMPYGECQDNWYSDFIDLIYKDINKNDKKDERDIKYKLINKFMSQIRGEYLRKQLFGDKTNNILKNIIDKANKNKDLEFFHHVAFLSKIKYDEKNDHERENFLNLFELCPSEIINYIDINFVIDNLNDKCVLENLKYLPEKCPIQNQDGSENENHKKIRLLCENKNFAQISNTQNEYWLKLIEYGPRDIIGYLDFKFIYRNLNNKLIQDHLKYIHWSINFTEGNSLGNIMKFIAREEKFYTLDMEQDLNNIFWQQFKHVKNDSTSDYKFLFLLNIHPETMENIDMGFLAENLLNENMFDMEFLKTNLFHIGGEDRIKSLFEYIKKNELDSKNKFKLLLGSPIFVDCLIYVDFDNSLINFAINKIESNVMNQRLRLCNKEKVSSIYKNIAELDLNEDKKITTLKMILCRISDEALNDLIDQNIIEKNVVNSFSGGPGNYILSADRKCISDDEKMTNFIKTSLKKFTVQKKKYDYSSEGQNQQNQISDNLNLQKFKNNDGRKKNTSISQIQNSKNDNIEIDKNVHDDNITRNKLSEKTDHLQNNSAKINADGNQNGLNQSQSSNRSNLKSDNNNNNNDVIEDDLNKKTNPYENDSISKYVNKNNSQKNNYQIVEFDNNCNGVGSVPDIRTDQEQNEFVNDNNNKGQSSNSLNPQNNNVNVIVNNQNIKMYSSVNCSQTPSQYQFTIHNNDAKKSNATPNNKKTRICLGMVGFVFIIAGICLFFTAPKIAIIFLVVGGLLFIDAIGFNKFRSCLCFNKSQIENSELGQNQQSINERMNNLGKEQYQNNNGINNENLLK